MTKKTAVKHLLLKGAFLPLGISIFFLLYTIFTAKTNNMDNVFAVTFFLIIPSCLIAYILVLTYYAFDSYNARCKVDRDELRDEILKEVENRYFPKSDRPAPTHENEKREKEKKSPINCANCGKLISRTADACPYCLHKVIKYPPVNTD